jgi:multisubunit Na+/H+ antiporter MnhF subunit
LLKRNKAYRYSSLGLLLLLGVEGITDAWLKWAIPDTLGRSAQTVAQFMYGIFGLLAAGYVIKGRRIPQFVEGLWTVSLTIATGLAPLVWSTANLFASAASTLAGLLLAIGTLWLSRRGMQTPKAV